MSFPSSPGTLHVSDFHIGRKPRSTGKKMRAFSRMMQHAADHHLSVKLGGDYLDDRAILSMIQEQSRDLENAISPLAKKKKATFIRGNHDARYTDEQARNLLGCEVEDSLVDVDGAAHVLSTHGHLLAVAKPKKLVHLLTGTGARDAVGSIQRDETIRAGLGRMSTIYGVAGGVDLGLDAIGLEGERVFALLERQTIEFRLWLASIFRTSTKKKHLLSSIADWIDHYSVYTAGLLAKQTDCWAAVAGHTHVPGVHKRPFVDAADGVVRTRLVGNSGSFVTDQPMTCVEACYPRLVLWEYSPGRDKLQEVSVVELTEEEQRQMPPPLPAGLKVIS